MGYFSVVHPLNPQPRLIRQAVEVLRDGGVIAYPTDSAYALGCHIGDKNAMERIRSLRQVDNRHNFTLMCRDLSEIASYAKIDNSAYRLLKAYTPGAYTFILKATHEVPRRLQNPKRKTIGIRVPDNAICNALLAELGEPLMTSTFIPAGQDLPLTDAEEIQERYATQVDLVIDGGHCGFEPTTVIDLVDGAPVVVRAGKGRTDTFAG